MIRKLMDFSNEKWGHVSVTKWVCTASNIVLPTMKERLPSGVPGLGFRV